MKYHIWTEGCQMNAADSQRVASELEKLGYRATREAEVVCLGFVVSVPVNPADPAGRPGRRS